MIIKVRQELKVIVSSSEFILVFIEWPVAWMTFASSLMATTTTNITMITVAMWSWCLALTIKFFEHIVFTHLLDVNIQCTIR